MSERRNSLLDSAIDSAIDIMHRASIDLTAAGAAVADEAGALAAAGAATMVSLLLSPSDKYTLWENFWHTNTQALARACTSVLGLLLFLGLMDLLPSSVNKPCLLMMSYQPIQLCMIASWRWSEKDIRNGFYIQLPTALALTAAAFVLFGGDLGNFTLPISTLIYSISVSTRRLVVKDQGNVFKAFLKLLPVSVMLLVSGVVPAYGVVAPALLLAQDPNLYAA
jgi:hypothetical protein